MKSKIIDTVIKEKIIVIVRGVASEKLVPLTEAMYKGGIRLLEVTFDASGKTDDKETAENIKILSEKFADRMYIGAGTVTKVSQVEHTKEAGGSFIISPNVNCDVIKRTVDLDMVSMPGAMTPSEIAAADEAGADFVKLFPVTTLGPDYIKAVCAPLSNIRMLAVGGINENNMKEYMNAGACGFGISSNILKKDLIMNNDFDGISKLAAKYVSIVKGE